jgi:hypothetical protein
MRAGKSPPTRRPIREDGSLVIGCSFLLRSRRKGTASAVPIRTAATLLRAFRP